MNRWIRLGIGAAVIVALVVVLIILRSTGGDDVAETPAYEPDPERVQLLRFSREEIEKIEIRIADGGLTVERTPDDTFLPVYAHQVAFVDSRINRIVSSASSLSSRRIIDESPADLSDYGLDQPAAEVTIRSSESDPVTLLIGNMNPAKDSYYTKLAGGDVVYTVYNMWISPFFSSLDDLRDKSMPVITPLEITELRIQNLDGRTIAVRAMTAEDDDAEMAYNSLIVTAPYKRALGVNTTRFEEITTAYSGLRIGRFVDDAPSRLADYGLSPARAQFSITDAQSSVLLLIGDPVDSGRFAKLAGRPSVFVIEGVEEIISTRPYDMISAFSLIVGIDLVDRFTVETPTETFTGTITREAAEDEGEDPIETFFLNGVEIGDELFRDLYQYAIGILVDAEASDPRPAPYIAKISYFLTEEPAPRSVEFVPYDANYLAMFRDGESEFLVANSKIDRLLSAFQDAIVE